MWDTLGEMVGVWVEHGIGCVRACSPTLCRLVRGRRRLATCENGAWFADYPQDSAGSSSAVLVVIRVVLVRALLHPTGTKPVI